VSSGGDAGEYVSGRVGEELRRRKKFFVSHASLTVLPSIDVLPAELQNVWTIVVAGGSGTRFGRPKQYEPLAERRMIDWSVEVARTVGGVVVVVPAADVERESLRFEHVLAGGDTRSASVRAGLTAVPASATVICVHDAARPFADAALYERVLAAVVAGADGAVPGVPVHDTIKIVDAAGVVVSTPARDTLVAVQTPQCFRADVLRGAHRAGTDGTDDSTLVERAGGRVVIVPGHAANRKITTVDDLEWARERILR
jgi:2-C-methyl-D-erythritol 4-phosphate cytidylyltransferase